MNEVRYYPAIQTISGTITPLLEPVFETVDAAKNGLYRKALRCAREPSKLLLKEHEDFVIVRDDTAEVVSLFRQTNGGEWLDVATNRKQV